MCGCYLLLVCLLLMFGPGSGLTMRRAWSECNLLDTLMVFMKYIFYRKNSLWERQKNRKKFQHAGLKKHFQHAGLKMHISLPGGFGCCSF